MKPPKRCWAGDALMPQITVPTKGNPSRAEVVVCLLRPRSSRALKLCEGQKGSGSPRGALPDTLAFSAVFRQRAYRGNP